MRRLIQFRAKREDDGKWVFGDLTHVQRIVDEGTKPQVRVNNYNVDENTVGQYTGTEDEKGTPIYENDIVEFVNAFEKKVYRYRVIYFGGCFALINCRISDHSTPFCNHIMSNYVVVGNIHDNAELLNI